MTFMFEYPHFVVSDTPAYGVGVQLTFYDFTFYQEIAVPTNRGKYNLYAYTEGQTMEKIKSMKFYGTPVVFIPGHSGSYRQGMNQWRRIR